MSTEAAPRFPGRRDPRRPFDPPASHRELKPLQQVEIWDGTRPWAVSRNALYRELITDPRISADIRRPGYPAMTEVFKELRLTGGYETFDRRDGEEHLFTRHIIMREFTLKRIEAMRPSLQQYLDTLFDNMLAGPQPCDLAAEVAFPFTSKVICNLLGVPYEDYDEFMVNVGSMMNTTSPAESIAAYEAMSHYVGGLVDRSAREPVGGVVGRVVSNELASGVITRRKAIDIVIALLLGGYETSATSMALGTLLLLTHPVQFVDLCANFEDTGLVSSTVEELLRFASITHKGRRRVAAQDIQIDGVTIHAGEGLVFLDDMSNRDPGAFAGDVDALDIRRDTTYHVAFSAGAHHCAGSRLARLELQLFFQTLARRVPSLALASDVGDLGFRVDAQIYGVDRVPVTWTAGGQL